MKIQIATITFILISFFLTAQTTNVLVQGSTEKIKFGDSYYQNNLKGIKYLVNDLKSEDAKLYAQIQPQYEALAKKQTNANIILGLGSTISGLFFISTIASVVDGFDDLDKGPEGAITSTVAGGLILCGTALIYSKKSVSPQDILNFTNTVNKASENNKIEFSLRPDFRLNNGFSGGLAINLRF